MNLPALAWDEATGEETRRVKLPFWVTQFLNDSTKFRQFWLPKGLGSGGTYGAVMWHYLMCEINDRSPFSWSVAPTFGQVEDTLIPTWIEVLYDQFGLVEDEDYKITRSQRPKLVFKDTGHTIRFRSADRADLMVGPSISHWTGTEIGLWRHRIAFEKCSARTRCKKAKRLQGLGEGTPEGEVWWSKETDFADGIDEGRNYHLRTLHTLDNAHHLPEGYFENLCSKYENDPAKLKSYTEGLRVPFNKGNAYWDWYDSRNVKIGLQTSPHVPILMCWDFGHAPLAWAGMQLQPFQRKNGDHAHRFTVLQNGTGKAKGLMDACAEFIAAFPVEEFRNTEIHVYGGHDGYSGTYLADSCAYDQILAHLKPYYSRVLIKASRAAPTVKDRLNRVNDLLAHELLVCAPHCRNVINSFTKTAMKEGMWELVKRPADKDFSHFTDALGDALFTLSKGMNLDKPTAKKRYGVNR